MLNLIAFNRWWDTGKDELREEKIKQTKIYFIPIWLYLILRA